MITENRVAGAIPKEGFLPAYLRYAVTRTDAPAVFHLGSALALLSVIAPPDLGLPWMPRVLRANFWTMLVGRSGDRKTSAIDAAIDVLKVAAPDFDVSEAPGSPEAFGAMLKDKPQRLIPYREFGSFLSGTVRGYARPLREKFTEAYDCTDTMSTVFKAKTITIEQPRVSLLVGVTPAYLQEFTAPGDWEGGFCARFCTLLADRERTITDPDTTIDHELSLQRIAAQLRPLVGVSGAEIGICRQPFDAAALRLWREWYADVEGRKTRVPERIAGSLQRMPMHALKAALLYAFDTGVARTGRGKTWALPPQILEAAIRLAEFHYESVLAVVDRVAESDDMRDRQTVLRVVSQGARELHEIVSASRLLPKRVNEILDALILERVISRSKAEDGEPRWRLRPKPVPAPAQPLREGSIEDAGRIVPLDGDIPDLDAALEAIPGTPLPLDTPGAMTLDDLVPVKTDATGTEGD